MIYINIPCISHGRTSICGVQSTTLTDMLRASLASCVVSITLLCTALVSADVSANVIKITSTDSQKQVIALDESAELSEQLAVSLMKRGDAYKPRTEHFLSNGQPTYLNRLIQEDSPYLLQHAHNPVNWYSWGEEAFAKAKSADKPVFLSIGYATCHWCHVMERESFESEAIAAILNEHFIAIKVDREQRPDVDATYMSAVQLLTGRGGWPMSSFLTGDAKPFYGGTYFTPDAFTGLLEQIAGLWQSDRETINQHADELSAAVADNAKLAGDAKQVGLLEIEKAVEQIISSHDDFQGGFGAAPKFPQESKLFLLLQQALRTGDGAALQAAHYTLQRMNAGGIHDQVGGGFHRYAVDEDWLVPHFEKMLYNQAALTRNYLQAFLLTGDKQHERTLRRALDYVLREMTSAKGGFYSATDADSEGEEGRFFLWTPKQLTDVLGEADAKLAMSVWNVSEQGNFESRNILHLEGPIQDVSEFVGLSEQQLTQKLDTFSAKLLEARQPREQPLRDEKIITAWNGMMITAFAEAGSSLREQRYIDAALQAGEFLWQNNRLNDDSLWRAHFDGSSSISAAQEDYAFLAEGFVMLFDVTGDQQWLDRAKTLESTMSARFWDGVDGGYYLGDLIVGGAALPVRPKDLYDSATPTGNAAALRVLVRLYHRTGNEKYKTRAQELIVAFSSYLHQFPSAFSYLLASASELFAGETGHRQYAARGKVMADAYVQDGKLNIAIRMADGWHINANEPIQDYLIATRLQSVDGVDLESAQYPVAVTKQLGFDRSELSLFENDVQIQADLPVLDATDGRAVTAVSLQLQACNDEVCLAPENITLTVSLATDS